MEQEIKEALKTFNESNKKKEIIFADDHSYIVIPVYNEQIVVIVGDDKAAAVFLRNKIGDMQRVITITEPIKGTEVEPPCMFFNQVIRFYTNNCHIGLVEKTK